MRNSTPKTNTGQDESSSNAEKSGVKKLRQARLPFKIISPSSSHVSSKTTTAPGAADNDKDVVKEAHSEGRKRKLSNDSKNDVANNRKENEVLCKENVQILTAADTKRKISIITNNDTAPEIVLLLDDEKDDVVEDSEDIGNCSTVSETGNKEVELKSFVKDRKDAGTPHTSDIKIGKNGSAPKLQIKLPLSGGKKKRRKSNLNELIVKTSAVKNSFENSVQDLSSDDIEELDTLMNPQKRQKLNNETDFSQNQVSESIALVLTTDEEETHKPTETQISSKAPYESDVLKKAVQQRRKTRSMLAKKTDKVEQSESSLKSDSKAKNVFEKYCDNDDVEKINISDTSDDNEKHGDDGEDRKESVHSENDNEADDDTKYLAAKSIMSDVCENLISKSNETIQKKNLTPKQVKLVEQRRKARDEKERKLQEEKIKKQHEKEEKEMAKKREREEKEELKRKEREEREEQKRQDREEKERKRLAEIEVKNEEKRKKNEAKEEEFRKKEEERKRKEQEKEEAELKKKKAAQAFTKFFVAKTPTTVQFKNEEDSNTGDGTKILAFRPFQIKGDMKLAPIIRKSFTKEAKICLDYYVGCNNPSNVEQNKLDVEAFERKINLPKSQLYLFELLSGQIVPGKWRRSSTESKDDVILVDEDMERVGQEIVEDIPAYVREEMRVKFYKFHDNRRPPYYGTWRKKSKIVKPRKPFVQDNKFFDYEVDSDDEWEEEEPGESLEDDSDDDKEKESEDDDYEVDNEWFVPHGHLSDEELQNEDEFGMGNDNAREAQKVKLQLLQQEFVQEMKRKTEKIKPRLIGCIWADINGNQPPECAKILWDNLDKKAMLFNAPAIVEELEVDRSGEANSPSSSLNGNTERATDKLRPITLSHNMIKDLTRLVHGNNHAKNFLINEYIAFVEKTENSVKNGDVRKPLKSVVREKIDEIAEWQSVDATASTLQQVEQTNDAPNEKKKKKVKRRLCWVVKQEMLDKMDLTSLELKNSWKYTLPPKFVQAEKVVKTDEAENLTRGSIVTSTEERPKEKHSETKSQTNQQAKETCKKRENASSSVNVNSTKKSDTGTKSNVHVTPKEKKRVPLLMSVARGEQISTPTKNKLISQFLQQNYKEIMEPSSPTTSRRRSKVVSSPNKEIDDVVILD